MDDLALQVGLVDSVELDDAQGADSGRGEIEQGGTAQTAGANDQHPGVLQPLLSLHADVGNDEVPAVAAYLVDGQLSGGLDQWWQRHTSSCDFGRGLTHGVLSILVSTPPAETLFRDSGSLFE